MCDFVTLCFAHLENIGSMSYTELPHVDIVQYISKITFVNIVTNPIRKVFKYW